MSGAGVAPLSPAYGADLRHLIRRAVDPEEAIPARPVPGGSIADRIAAEVGAGDAAIICGGDGGKGPDSARAVPVRRYFVRALGHRMLLPVVLMDLAALEVPDAERARAERRLIVIWERRYLQAPLPPIVLELLRDHAVGSGARHLVPWLDAAREEVMTSSCLEDAEGVRTRLRLDALRRGASGRWDELAVSVAELMTDLLVLARAAAADVEGAIATCADAGRSVGEILAERDRDGSLHLEAALRRLLRPGPVEDALEAGEREALGIWAARRPPWWRAGLIACHAGEDAGPARVTERAHAAEPPREPEPADSDPTETPRESYLRIREGLEARIIGQQELTRQLALAGAAHLAGVRGQNLLLAGPSGAGKTYAAFSLAEVLGRPFHPISCVQLGPSGWKGANLVDLLEGAAGTAGRLGDAVFFLDEIDKLAVTRGVGGTTREHARARQADLLPLLDGRALTSESGHTRIDTANLLVVAAGAFRDQFVDEAPSTQALVRWGFMPELANRWGQKLLVRAPTRAEALELLRSSERAVGRRLGPLLEALGMRVIVPEAALQYAADRWLASGSDVRTATEWLLAAARTRIIDALERGAEGPVVLAPDDLRPAPPPRDRRRR